MKITSTLHPPARANSFQRSHSDNRHSFDAHMARGNGAPVQAAVAALKANPNPAPAAFGHLVAAFSSNRSSDVDLPPSDAEQQIPDTV
jgi:hypothetical protein